jgi:hypothetical protein
LQKFHPSGKGYGKEVTIGQYVTDLLLSQNYFETIFTRIPKKATDDIVAELKAQGLPHTPIGNGGQGGPDRRGTDDGRARPASVKVPGFPLCGCVKLPGYMDNQCHTACLRKKPRVMNL